MRAPRGTPTGRAPLVCVLAVATAVAVLLGPAGRARAIDLHFSGSAQLDYFYVPFRGEDPRPRTHTIDGFTEELGVKLAVDFNPHVAGSVKVCWGCHGFELPMGFVDFYVADELTIRAGRFSPTFGGFQQRWDVGNHRTSDRPLPYDMGRMLHLFDFNRSVLPIPYVDNGIEVSGSHFFGRRVQVDYAVHAVTGLRANTPAPYDIDFSATRAAAPFYVDNNSVPSVGGRLGATFRLGDRIDLSVGASGIYGPYDPNGRLSYAILGGDALLRVGRTYLRAEYLIRRTEMARGTGDPAERFEDPLPPGNGNDPLFFIKDGFYVELEQPLNRVVDMVLRFDGLRRVGNRAPGGPLDFDAGILRSTVGANFVITRGYRIKASVEHYYFWGLRNAPPNALGFHLSAVAVF